MKDNGGLQKDVKNAIKWEPMPMAAKNVGSVKGVVEKTDVESRITWRKNDRDLEKFAMEDALLRSY